MYIYKITNLINSKVYVGQTNNKKRRFKKHKTQLRNQKHSNKHLQAAWNKYGEESFKFEIIEEFDTEMNFDIHAIERYWIKKFDSNNNEWGYNKTAGGEGSIGYKPTLETRKKISKSLKGNKYALGYKHTKESKKKISDSLKGRPCSDASKRRLAEYNKKAKSKPIVCLTNNKIYPSLREAGRKLNITATQICAVLKGTYTHAKGYKFKYLEAS